MILVYCGWSALALLTPFYHPYARLWLPLHAFECVFLAGAIGVMHTAIETAAPAGRDTQSPQPVRLHCFWYLNFLTGRWVLPPVRLHWFWYLNAPISLAFSVHFIFSYLPPKSDLPGFPPQNPMLPGVLAPTDPLKTASISIARDLPKNVKTLRVLARPPLTFYLGQMTGVPMETQANLIGLLRPADTATWALLDTAIIRQDEDLAVELKRSSAEWVLVRAIPTPLSLPVLLDIDPSVATSRKPGVQVELRLMRPRRAGDLP